jgi:hypothetical protein
VARISRGGMWACVNRAPSPPLIFIEHANVLHHHRLISIIIRLESNPCKP